MDLRRVARWAANLQKGLAVITMLASAALVAPCALAQATPPTSSTATSAPANSFSIRGSLRLSSSGQGLEMVKVELKKFTGETVAVSFTRSNGEFEFAGLSRGMYVIEVIEGEYEPIRESVEILNTQRTGVFLFLREPPKLGESPTGASVPARELALPSDASEALGKGREQLFARKNPGASLKHFQKLAREAPGFYEAHYYMGVAHSEMGQMQAAEEEFRTAIAASESSDLPSLVSLASILSNQKRFAEAEPLARKSVELQPTSWPAQFELARSLLGLNRPEEAYQSAQIALGQKKDLPDLHILLADICIRRQDARGLLTALDSYLALRPEGAMSDRVRSTRKQLLEQMAQAGVAPPQKQPPRN